MDRATGAMENPFEAAHRLATLPDDQLGSIVMLAVMSELAWTPDLGPSVIDRLERDAIAYPEHFARGPAPGKSAGDQAGGSSRRRIITIGLILVLAATAIAVGLMLLGQQGAAAAPSLSALLAAA